MMTTALVSANDMATDSSISGNVTLEKLLANVQDAVADDPALANMFNISSASQLSEDELTTILQGILTASLSGSYNASSSSSLDSMESTQNASSTGSTVSGASTVSWSVAMAVLVTMVALGAAL